MGMGKKLKRALGVVLAPFTGGMSLIAGEAAYQQDKASKAQEQAQTDMLNAEASAEENAKKATGEAITKRKQKNRAGSLLGGYSASDGMTGSSGAASKTLLGQ